MPHFKYTARSKSGEKLSGTVAAPSKAAAADEIQRMGLFPVAIDSGPGQALAAENPTPPRILFPDKLQRLDYALRLIMWFIGVPVIAAFLLPLPKYIGIPQWLPFVVIILLVPLRFPCADIPRFRSIGWSPWLVLLFLIPFVNFVVQLLLLFTPSKQADA
jgi:hypothetical protein